jgi:hypothetical protein
MSSSRHYKKLVAEKKRLEKICLNLNDLYWNTNNSGAEYIENIENISIQLRNIDDQMKKYR